MCKHRLLIVALMLSLLSYYAFAQEQQKLHLSIQDMFELIDKNNKDIKVAKTAIDVAKQDINIAKSERLPDLSASLSISYNGDATLMDRNFSDVKRAETPHFGNKFNINLYQPIYSGGAISGGINLAQSKKEMSDIALHNTSINMRFDAISFYLNLYKNINLLKVYNQNIILTEKLIENMVANKEQGIVLKNDITRYELRLSTLKYDRTCIENNIHILNHDLCSYLGVNQNTVIVPDSAVISIELPMQSVNDWKETALSNSLDLRRISTEQRIINYHDKIIRSERMPHIGIIAGNTLDGPITYEVPPIDKNINYWWVGLNVSYNISSLFKTNTKTHRNKFEKLHLADKYEATTTHIDREIEQTYTSYLQAHEQLITQQKNVELATENYRIVDKRYNNQLALLTDMIDASVSKLDADIRLVNAKINTIFYYYKLKFISGTL